MDLAHGLLFEFEYPGIMYKNKLDLAHGLSFECLGIMYKNFMNVTQLLFDK